MSIRDSLRRLFGRAPQPAPVPMKIRSFDGGRTDEITFGFTAANNAIDVDLASALERMRGRSRNLAHNNDYARKFLSMVEANVVGPAGFSLQVLAREGDRLDAVANSLIEAAFRDWSRKGAGEVSGQYAFRDVCATVAQTVARDGEALVRLVRGAASGNKYGFALQVLDVDRLPVTMNGQAANGNQIVMGIELDTFGRAVAYHIHRRHPGALSGRYGSTEIERVPATDMLHLFRSARPEQRRGVPAMHTAMIRLEMLSKFEKAAVVAARKGAETLGFFKSATGEAPKLDGVAADGNQITTSVPGSFDTLPEGMEFQPFDTKYPNEMFGAFVKSTLRGIASGLGVSYNALASDLEGVNYSSLRAGVLEERDQWMTLQNWLIEAFLSPVYEGWLRTALLAGAIRYPGGSALPATKLEKFLPHAWQGRRWAWVDPLKDIEANIAAINAGLKSRREVIAEQGRDLDEVWAQLQAEKDESERLGLAFGRPEDIDPVHGESEESVSPSA